MASRIHLTFPFAVLLWILVCKVQISSTLNMTVSSIPTTTSSISSNASINTSSTALAAVPPVSTSVVNQSSSKFNGDTLTMLSTTNFTTNFERTVVTKSSDSLFTVNGSSLTDYTSIHTKTTATTRTVTALSNSSINTSKTVGTTSHSTSASTVSIFKAGLHNRTVIMTYEPTSSQENSINRTTVAKYNSTVLSPSRASSGTYFMMETNNINNATISSPSHFNSSVTSTSTQNTISVGPTLLSISSFNGSQSVAPTSALSSQKYLSSSTNFTILISTTSGDASSFAHDNGNMSVSGEHSLSISRINSYMNNNASVSLLQSPGNATTETMQTSVVELMESSVILKSTPDSNKTSSQVERVDPSIDHNLTSILLLPSPRSTTTTTVFKSVADSLQKPSPVETVGPSIGNNLTKVLLPSPTLVTTTAAPNSTIGSIAPSSQDRTIDLTGDHNLTSDLPSSKLPTTTILNITKAPILSLRPDQTIGLTVDHNLTSTLLLLPSLTSKMTTIINNTKVSILSTSQVQTVDLSVNHTQTSASLSTSLSSVVSITQSSSQTDDIIMMSYATPCYVTYIITQAINETSLQPTIIAMETSINRTILKMSSTFNKSEIPNTTKSPIATMTTSKMSVGEYVSPSVTTDVMKSLYVNQSSSPELTMVNTLSTDRVQYSSAIQPSSIQVMSTQVSKSYNMSIFPTPVMPSIETTLFENENSIRGATSNNTVVMATTWPAGDNFSSSIEPRRTSSKPVEASTIDVIHITTALNTTSLASHLKMSFVSMTTATLPLTMSTLSPNATAVTNHTIVSSNTGYNTDNVTLTTGIPVSILLLTSTYNTVNTAVNKNATSVSVVKSSSTYNTLNTAVNKNATPVSMVQSSSTYYTLNTVGNKKATPVSIVQSSSAYYTVNTVGNRNPTPVSVVQSSSTYNTLNTAMNKNATPVSVVQSSSTYNTINTAVNKNVTSVFMIQSSSTYTGNTLNTAINNNATPVSMVQSSSAYYTVNTAVNKNATPVSIVQSSSAYYTVNTVGNRNPTPVSVVQSSSTYNTINTAVNKNVTSVFIVSSSTGKSLVSKSSVSNEGAKRRRRRNIDPQLVSSNFSVNNSNSSNFSVNSPSATPSINNIIGVTTSTFLSSPLQVNNTTPIPSNTIISFSQTIDITKSSTGHTTASSITLTTASIATLPISSILLYINRTTPFTILSASLTGNRSLISAIPKSTNVAYSMSTVPALAMTTTSSTLPTPELHANTTSANYTTAYTSTVAESLSPEATNTSTPAVLLPSISYVLNTLIPKSNSSHIPLESTSVSSSLSANNISHIAPPITVTITTSLVISPIPTTNTSNLNNAEVSRTSSTEASLLVSPSLASNFFNVTLSTVVTMSKSITNTTYNLNNTEVSQTTSTGSFLQGSPSLASRHFNVTSASVNVRLNHSHMVSSTLASPTSSTTFTPTSIYPTPQLTSLTVFKTTSDVTSGAAASSSSSSRKNILLTTSSLSICYVIYTTRIMHSSIVSNHSTVTGMIQTTAHRMSTDGLVNTSYMMASSSASSKSKSNFEMNSTILQAATGTTYSLSINATLSSKSVQRSTSSIQVNATQTFNSSYTSKSVVLNNTLLPRTTSAPSMLSIATPNSTLYPILSSSNIVHDILSSSSSQVTSSFSALSPYTSSSSLIYQNMSSSSSSSLSSSLSLSSQLMNSSSVLPSYDSTRSVYLGLSQTSSSQVISPSMTSVVMTTSSVVTATLPPTTVPAPDINTLVKTTLQIPHNINEKAAELQRNISKGLEESFNTADRARRRRRATEGTEAKIYNITRRSSPSTDTVVLFSIAKNGKTLSADQTVAVYNKTANLSKIGVWKVVRRPETFISPTPPPQSILVSMIFERIVKDLSVPSNKKALEDKLASYYKSKKNTIATVTATIYVVVPEKTNHVYIQFYVTEDGRNVPASEVVRVFEVDHVQQLTAYLQEQVIVAPYTDESIQGRETDYVETRFALPPSTNLQDAAFHRELGDKLARVYIGGKAKSSSRRKRRAVGSVSATIVNATAVNGLRGFADVVFFIFDSGKVANATYAAAIFNRLNINEMSVITSPYAVIKNPVPVIVPKVTEKPPVTIPPVVVRYWIIGAVLGPIFLLIVIILLVYWRWKTGAPQGKVQPVPEKTPEHLRKAKMHPMQTHEVVRYAEGNPPTSKITNMSFITERSYENLPKRETSLRRKVPKTTIQKRGDMSRSNAAYEESEEDEDFDDSFITVSSTPSQSRIITAQPGPGMKDIKTLTVPVRSTPRRTPQKIREEEEQEEETETGLSESEVDSIATTRTDQTKFSAAQVPTVAVMGGSSGSQPQVPVRFRSSVHPVSSLPPIKQSSLVGPPTDDQEELTPRKSKKRSKAAQQELRQKADMERLRNKKRQRERKNKITPVQTREKRAWGRDDLERVLDPKPIDPFTRSKRRKPQRSKRTDSVATDEDAIELKSFRRHNPEDSMETRAKDEEHTEDQSGESSDDSSISMEETRKRMHNLLDDAFSLLEPLSQKQKQKPKTLEGPGDFHHRPPVSARYAGSIPALPEPAPAHGRASEPTPRQRRRLDNTGGYPHGIPQTPIGPGHPIRHPVRPPLVTRDPMVVWDPYDRQRYINQRMGFLPEGGRNPTYTYTDPQGQNVYITPVQQQRDYLGGPIWSPYTAEDTMDELYPDLSKQNYPGSFGTSPLKDPGYRDVTSRDTVIDMNDQYGQRGTGLGQTPQPLIRSIKDELMRLSKVRKTPITEL